jgi:hypothetical protein
MPAPSTPKARNLHREAQALIEQAAVQQAESSASCIRQQGSARDDGGAQGPEPSVHTGGAAERPANPGRTPAKERLLDTRGFHRVRGYDEGANQRAREDSLDQLDEARTMALMHSSRYHQSLRRYQARKVRRRDFSEGDLVLRLRQDNRGRHKLSPPWEGPYIVVKVLKPGTYKLANEDGEEFTNAWNIQQLRRFYP